MKPKNNTKLNFQLAGIILNLFMILILLVRYFETGDHLYSGLLELASWLVWIVFFIIYIVIKDKLFPWLVPLNLFILKFISQGLEEYQVLVGSIYLLAVTILFALFRWDYIKLLYKNNAA